MDEDIFLYVGLVFFVDFGSWFVVIEYVKSEIENVFICLDNINWYVMGGFCLDKWIFVLIYLEIDVFNFFDIVYENIG